MLPQYIQPVDQAQSGKYGQYEPLVPLCFTPSTSQFPLQGSVGFAGSPGGTANGARPVNADDARQSDAPFSQQSVQYQQHVPPSDYYGVEGKLFAVCKSIAERVDFRYNISITLLNRMTGLVTYAFIPLASFYLRLSCFTGVIAKTAFHELYEIVKERSREDSVRGLLNTDYQGLEHLIPEWKLQPIPTGLFSMRIIGLHTISEEVTRIKQKDRAARSARTKRRVSLFAAVILEAVSCVRPSKPLYYLRVVVALFSWYQKHKAIDYVNLLRADCSKVINLTQVFEQDYPGVNVNS